MLVAASATAGALNVSFSSSSTGAVVNLAANGSTFSTVRHAPTTPKTG